MSAVRSLSPGSYGLPAGAWRWAALGFVLLALMAAGLAVAAPEASRWLGLMLVAGIGAVASLFFYAVWPRERGGSLEARRVAEAAARANVAWAVTGADGAVLDCNDAYRRMAGAKAGEAGSAARTGAWRRSLLGDALPSDPKRRSRRSARRGRDGRGRRHCGRGASAARWTDGLVVYAATFTGGRNAVRAGGRDCHRSAGVFFQGRARRCRACGRRRAPARSQRVLCGLLRT